MKIALFVDFDNVYSGLRRLSAEAAERFSRQPLRWLQWLTDGLDSGTSPGATTDPRRVLVRRCYLNPVMYQTYRRAFQEAGFEIVDCPPMTATGKTSTDIHLVLDTMDALLDATRFDEFIVFSADADFSPLLRRLRRHDRRTVVFAAGAMSESYKASADRVIDLQTFLHDALEIASPEDEDDLSLGLDGGAAGAGRPGDDLRRQCSDEVHRIVMQATAPVPLPFLAQALQRRIAGLRESRWDGTGSFAGLMRQLTVPGVMFDFQQDVAVDSQRGAERPGSAATVMDPEAVAGVALHERRAVATAGAAAEVAVEPLDERAGQIVRRLVEGASEPVHLATVAQVLRRQLPELLGGWAGAPSLAAFLARLDLGALQRTVLENGKTAVLYDPARHEAPLGMVGDRLVAGMLRAAELPELRGAELVGLLAAARPFMGTTDRFEIASVSRAVVEAMSTRGARTSPRRAAAVLQALIFGGLDANRPYVDEADLLAAALGVILSAWERETMAPPDEETRHRLVGWLGLDA
ncbi:NYN domain-containing protein [Variovorax sp. PvP013]|uniref:NYN domain-containing protein n=1 Tax=Variovorax sp. PvP013 TaxID=3156435 RepID=UPI003D24ADC5